MAHPEVRGVGVVEGLQGLHGGARLGSWYELHWIQSTKKNEVVCEVLPIDTLSFPIVIIILMLKVAAKREKRQDLRHLKH